MSRRNCRIRCLSASTVLAFASAGVCLGTAKGAESSTEPSDIYNMNLEQLANVEIDSATKTTEKVKDVPAAVTVISQEDIQRNNFQDIPEMLRLSPGIFVQRSGQIGGWTVASRGFASPFNNSLLVLQDGRTLYNPIYSGAIWDTVDYFTPDLERIEVVRGPGGTLWGANAVNGVININTKSARDTQGFMIDTQVSNDESVAGGRYGGKIDDDTYFRVYGKGKSVESLPDAQGEDAGNDWYSAKSGFRVDKYYNAQDTLTLEGDVAYQSIGASGIAHTLTPPYDAPTDLREYATTGDLIGKYNHSEGRDANSTAQVYYDYVTGQMALGSFDINTFDAQFEHRFKANDQHEFVWGVEGRAQRVGTQNNLDAGPIMAPQYGDMYLGSAFVQDGITLVPKRLKWYIGTKAEVNSFTGFELQPSTRLAYTPDDKNTIWVGVSRAVRTPSYSNEHATNTYTVLPPQATGTPFPGLVQIQGNENLDSEQLTAYEAGYRYEPTKQLSFDISGFVNQYRDLIFAQPQTPSFSTSPVPHLAIPQRFVNGASAESYGGEFASTVRPTSNWRLTGSYSFILIQAHADGASNEDESLEGSTPANLFQIHSYLDITKHLELNTGLYYVDSCTDVPSYWRADANITWKPNDNVRFSVGVENAFDPQHLEANYGSFYGATAEVPRVYYARLTCQW